MMALLNEIYDVGSLTSDELKTLVRLICPFAPHLAEELWEMLGGEGLCSLAAWPEWDESKTVDSTVEVAVQINGKVRGTVALPLNCPKDDAIAIAKADPRIAVAIEGKTVVKEISVPNKIVNIVVK
jgi:leucyl-tRNA synthetase